jgi:mannosyl-oligosaccharide alpha-1,3-glucosidase
VQSFVDNELVMTLNENDSLYFEKSTGKNEDTCID